MLLGVLSAIGCGSEFDLDTFEVYDSPQVDVIEQPLTAGEWGTNGWSPLAAVLGNTSVTLAGTPVACEAPRGGGTALFGRNEQNRFVASFRNYSPFTHWLELGTQTFTSKPACADLDGIAANGGQSSRQLAVFGRGALNRYYVQVLQMHESCTFGTTPPTPNLVRNWTQLSTTAFASAPAATVYAGALWLVGRTSSNQMIMRRKWLNPDLNDRFGDPAAWDGEYPLSALPTGFVAIGDPAMIHVPEDDGYMIVATFAQNSSGAKRLYYALGSGVSFSSWMQVSLPSGVTVASDLALEVGRQGRGANGPGIPPSRVTAYFRGTKVVNGSTDSRVYQASANVSFTSPYVWQSFTALQFPAAADIQVADSPAAAGGYLGTDGAHSVIAKRSGTNQLYVVQSHQTVD